MLEKIIVNQIVCSMETIDAAQVHRGNLFRWYRSSQSSRLIVWLGSCAFFLLCRGTSIIRHILGAKRFASPSECADA